MSIFKKMTKSSIFALCVIVGASSYATPDDDYLKQLEMEASEDVVDDPMSPAGFDESANEDPSLEAPATDVELITNKKELIVDQKSFEKALNATYPESYALYQQLTDDEKNIIYQHFTKEKRLYNSTVKIISLYIASH